MYGAIAVLLGVYLWARTKSSADETAIDAIEDPAGGPKGVTHHPRIATRTSLHSRTHDVRPSRG